MLKKCVRVELPSGLEARPAAMLGNQMGNG